MICSLCRKKVEKTAVQSHIKKHVEDSYNKEVKAYRETQAAVVLYKRLFKQEP